MVDIGELFDVIDAYFNGTPCLSPEPGPTDALSSWTETQFDSNEPVYTVLNQEGGPDSWP